MTPGQIAHQDQMEALRQEVNREVCQQRGHWFALGWGGKCLRCGDSKTDSVNGTSSAPQWYQGLFGADS